MTAIQEAIEMLGRLRDYEYRQHDTSVCICLGYIHDGLQLAKSIEQTNATLLEALQYFVENVIIDGYDAGDEPLNTAWDKAKEAIRKAKSHADTLKGE